MAQLMVAFRSFVNVPKMTSEREGRPTSSTVKKYMFASHVIRSFVLQMVFIALWGGPQQPYLGLGCLVVDILIFHTDAPHTVGLLWKRDRPFAETCTLLRTFLILFSYSNVFVLVFRHTNLFRRCIFACSY